MAAWAQEKSCRGKRRALELRRKKSERTHSEEGEKERCEHTPARERVHPGKKKEVRKGVRC